jgi:hypothetical protein
VKPSEKCKAAGLKSLAELAQITGRPERTLTEWARTDPDWFDLVLAGAVFVKLARLRTGT